MQRLQRSQQLQPAEEESTLEYQRHRSRVEFGNSRFAADATPAIRDLLPIAERLSQATVDLTGCNASERAPYSNTSSPVGS